MFRPDSNTKAGHRSRISRVRNASKRDRDLVLKRRERLAKQITSKTRL